MDNKQEKSKSLFRNVVLFFLASFVPKAISFFMVPLYTHCLTTEQYGNIDLITTTVQLLMPILTLQVQDAVLVFAMNKKEDPTKVLSTALWIVIAGFVLLLLGTVVVLTTGYVELEWGYIAFFLAHYLTGALTNIITYFVRALDRVKNITVSSIIACVITVGSNLVSLLVFRWGINGYLFSNVLGHLISLIYLCKSVRIRNYFVFRFSDWALIKRMVRFSLPLIVSALAWWANNSLDKYILEYFYGASSIGLLAVAYKIPTIVSLLSTTVSKAFSVSVLQNFSEKDEDGFLGNSYGMMSFVMVMGSSVLMLINIPLAKILFQNDFFDAWKLVPPLLVAATMNHISLSCQNISIAMGKTKLVSGTAMIGAIVNLILNLFMIPNMGAYGAALATAVGFSVVWLVRYIWMKQNMELKNHQFQEIISYGVLYGQMILSYWGNRFLAIQMTGTALLLFLYRKEIVDTARPYFAKCLGKRR